MARLTMQERRSILSGPGQITDAPKGISDSFAILKHCFPTVSYTHLTLPTTPYV